MDEINARIVGTPERQLRVAEQGQGRDVLLIHGTLMGLEDMMLGLADPLTQAGFRVVAIDRPGHGGSTRPRGECNFWQHAATIRGLLDDIPVEKPLVIGHSAGASTALALALADPEALSGLILISPLVFPEPRIEHVLFGPFSPVGTGDWLAARSERIARDMVLPLLREAIYLPQRMPDHVRRVLPARLGDDKELVTTGEDAMSAPFALAQSLFMLPRLEVPLHIMLGEADFVVSPDLHGKILSRLVPDAQLTLFPDLGHMIHHFAQPTIVDVVREMARQGGKQDRQSGPHLVYAAGA